MKEFFVTNDDYEKGNPGLRLQNSLNSMAANGWAVLKIEFYRDGSKLWVTCIFEREKQS